MQTHDRHCSESATKARSGRLDRARDRTAWAMSAPVHPWRQGVGGGAHSKAAARLGTRVVRDSQPSRGCGKLGHGPRKLQIQWVACPRNHKIWNDLAAFQGRLFRARKWARCAAPPPVLAAATPLVLGQSALSCASSRSSGESGRRRRKERWTTSPVRSLQKLTPADDDVDLPRRRGVVASENIDPAAVGRHVVRRAPVTAADR